ncbi:hypothetical protein Hanom_Chr02g00101791 [Helianthus anomalus]
MLGGRKKDDTKHVTAKRQKINDTTTRFSSTNGFVHAVGDNENEEVKWHKSGCGGGEDAAMTVEPEPENEVVP